jgi:small subunit ribosomal protein S2
MLTNFQTIRKSLKKMSTIDRLMKDEAYKSLAKREQLTITRQRQKLEKILGGVADLTRLPAALFVVDAKKEHIAIAEAQRLGIPVFGVVDTNSDPDGVDYVIPGNDDAFKSIALITSIIGAAIEDALVERKKSKDEEEEKAKDEEAIRSKTEEAEA